LSALLCVEMLPPPSFSPPLHTADALRLIFISASLIRLPLAPAPLAARERSD
jgi:hypothetical protein